MSDATIMPMRFLIFLVPGLAAAVTVNTDFKGGSRGQSDSSELGATINEGAANTSTCFGNHQGGICRWDLKNGAFIANWIRRMGVWYSRLEMTPPVAVPMVEPGAKVRMVQSIEHLDPELMLEAFLEPRVFDDWPARATIADKWDRSTPNALIGIITGVSGSSLVQVGAKLIF